MDGFDDLNILRVLVPHWLSPLGEQRRPATCGRP